MPKENVIFIHNLQTSTQTFYPIHKRYMAAMKPTNKKFLIKKMIL